MPTVLLSAADVLGLEAVTRPLERLVARLADVIPSVRLLEGTVER